MKSALLSLLIIASFIHQNINAQAGKPDRSFGDTGVLKIPVIVSQQGYGTSLTARKLIGLRGEKFIAVVSALPGSGIYDNYLYRINRNGTIDSSFARHGRKVIHTGSDEFYLYDVVEDSDNNLIISTSTTQGDYGAFGFKLSRLLPNGDKDTTFGDSGIVIGNFVQNIYGHDGMLSIQPDGKILASAPQYRVYYLPSNSVLFRFNKNGKLDSSFGNSGHAFFGNPFYGEYPHGFMYFYTATQPNNKIIYAGTAITQLNSNGKKNKSFANGDIIYGDSAQQDEGLAKEVFHSINVQNNGSFMVIGSFRISDKYSDGTITDKVYKFNKNGLPDSNFGVNGEVLIDRTSYYSDFGYPGPEVNNLVEQPDKKFILSNAYNDYYSGFTYKNVISRYLRSGAKDKSFGSKGDIIKADHKIAGIVLQNDLKIVTLENILTDSNPDTAFIYLYRYKNDVDASSLVTGSSNKEKSIQAKPSIKISPNPVANILNIKGLANNAHLSVINAEGKVFAAATALSDNYKWNIQGLHAGNYFLVVEKDNENIASIQFIKQ